MTPFLYSLITFCIAFFFILLGFIGVILPWSTGMQNVAIYFIQHHTAFIFLFGFSSLLIGAITAVNLWLNTQRQYYHSKVNGQTVSIDTELIQTYLYKYLKELFPGRDVPYRLQVKKNKIHITIDLPSTPDSEQEVLLERIQSELYELFQSLLGYRHTFHLEVSFHES
ncbi:MAG: hypothetical protein ACXU9U_03855 [Parachlamydiaceae bacterium]